MIYFLQGEPGTPIKIGTTEFLSRRLKGISRTLNVRLNVLAVMRGSNTAERKTHDRFAHLRLTHGNGFGRTEWFLPAQELLDFIALKGVTWNGLDEKTHARFLLSRKALRILRGMSHRSGLTEDEVIEVLIRSKGRLGLFG